MSLTLFISTPINIAFLLTTTLPVGRLYNPADWNICQPMDTCCMPPLTSSAFRSATRISYVAVELPHGTLARLVLMMGGFVVGPHRVARCSII